MRRFSASRLEDPRRDPSSEHLAHLELELRLLLEMVDVGVLLLDAKEKVRFVNPPLAQLFGMDATDLGAIEEFGTLLEEIQRAVSSRMTDAEAFVEHWRKSVARGAADSGTIEFERPERMVIERTARPVMAADGRRLGRIEVFREITTQRVLHSRLLRTEKMAALGQLVSGIAHELNNPLTSIRGYAQLLLTRRLRAERVADAERIYREAERAGHIVRNLLLFARETRSERKPVNLNEVVERILALRSYELRIENIAVELHLDPHLPFVLGDAQQLQQVVLNLIINAEQAILHDPNDFRTQGCIQIQTRKLHRKSAGHAESEKIVLEISDNGPGIPPQIAPRVFDPFFTTKPPGVGTGLGLSIVYGILQEHGGDICHEPASSERATSAKGGLGGATFVVELPVLNGRPSLTDPAVRECGGVGEAEETSVNCEIASSLMGLLPRAARESPNPEKRAPATQEEKKILVVEDEATVAQLVADVLREAGYAVDIVLDPYVGSKQVERIAYDLILCDLRMAGMDGRAFFDALVRSGSPARHRIVFITGDTLSQYTTTFLEKTGLPCLAKPFLVEDLKEFVRRGIESARKRTDTALRESADSIRPSNDTPALRTSAQIGKTPRPVSGPAEGNRKR